MGALSFIVLMFAAWWRLPWEVELGSSVGGGNRESFQMVQLA